MAKKKIPAPIEPLKKKPNNPNFKAVSDKKPAVAQTATNRRFRPNTAPAIGEPGSLTHHKNGNPAVMTPKQIRARARRSRELAKQAAEVIYNKPLEEWDEEEIAAGRPKDPQGRLAGGPRPEWITRALQEQALDVFKDMVKQNLRVLTLKGLQMLDVILTSDDVDEKGRPIISAAVKLDAAKFLLEHQVGKATQPIQADISVKLQGILADVLVNPADLAASDQQYTTGWQGSRGIAPAGQVIEGQSRAAITGPMDTDTNFEDDEDDE